MTEHPFIGNALVAIDKGGRLTLPAFVRSTLARRSDARLIFAGCHDSDPCLVAYDRSFARTLAVDCRRLRVREGWAAPEGWHAQVRRTFGFVEQIEMDSRGKVPLPPMLLRRALRNAVDALASLPKRAVPRLTVSTRVSGGGMLEFIVADNGPGIAPQLADRIFEPFMTTKAKGMGMGLSVCRRLIESHGGTIDADSTPGAGAAFRVRLPQYGSIQPLIVSAALS